VGGGWRIPLERVRRRPYCFWAYSRDSSPCLHGGAGRIWVIVVIGVLLFIAPLDTPFVFGGVATATAAYTAYAIGVLIAAIGLCLLANPAKVVGEWIEVLVGVVLVASPFLLGFSGVVVVAYTAWIIGALAVLLAGSVILTRRRRPAPAH
jgi:SPW repeat